MEIQQGSLKKKTLKIEFSRFKEKTKIEKMSKIFAHQNCACCMSKLSKHKLEPDVTPNVFSEDSEPIYKKKSLSLKIKKVYQQAARNIYLNPGSSIRQLNEQISNNLNKSSKSLGSQKKRSKLNSSPNLERFLRIDIKNEPDHVGDRLRKQMNEKQKNRKMITKKIIEYGLGTQFFTVKKTSKSVVHEPKNNFNKKQGLPKLNKNKIDKVSYFQKDAKYYDYDGNIHEIYREQNSEKKMKQLKNVAHILDKENIVETQTKYQTVQLEKLRSEQQCGNFKKIKDQFVSEDVVCQFWSMSNGNGVRVERK